MEIALVGATVIFHGATEIDQIKSAKALGPALQAGFQRHVTDGLRGPHSVTKA